MPSQVLARNHTSKEEQIAVAFESMDRIARHARQSCQLGLGDVDETKHQRAVYLENGGRSDAATEAGWCWRSVSAEWLALMPGCIIAATSQPRRAGRRRIFNRRSRTRFGARFEGGDEPTPSALTQHFQLRVSRAEAAPTPSRFCKASPQHVAPARSFPLARTGLTSLSQPP